MKSKYLSTVLFLLSAVNFMFSQDKLEIKKPSEGKSLVYLIRSNGVGGALNFRLFENNKFLGTISYGDYILYECEPGDHMFWAASENRDFVDAKLEPNKTYVIDVQGKMGAFIAGVNLEPLDPNKREHRKFFHKAVKKHTAIVFNENSVKSQDKSQNIIDGLERYKKLKEKESSDIKTLDASMFFENADKPL